MNRKRKTNRLSEYDYSQNGVYFITICVRNRDKIFGTYVNDTVSLNGCGLIAEKCWKELPAHICGCEIDEFVIMPDHVHGIIVISESDICNDNDIAVVAVGNRHACSLRQRKRWGTQKRPYQKLPIIIGSYKSAVSKIIHRLGYDGFKWQKSYWDRIIRDGDELIRIRKYIINNPIKNRH